MSLIDLTFAGEGSTVVFLHGSPTPPDVLAIVSTAVAKTHRSVTVSLPGYGKSPPLHAGWTLTDLHVAVESALLEAGVVRATFVGFSAGAYHALALATRGAVAAERVITLAGLLAVAPEERAGYVQFADALDAGVDLHGVAGSRFLSAQGRTPENIAKVAAWLDATSPANLSAELRAFANADDLTAGVRALTVPLVARVGSEDVASPVAKSQAIIDAAKYGTLQIVPGSGHALTIEDPAGTIGAVVEALR